MFARFRSHADELREERARVARKAPHLALVDHVPTPPKPPEPEMFVWHDVSVLLSGDGEG